jgi:hypothetical protein
VPSVGPNYGSLTGPSSVPAAWPNQLTRACCTAARRAIRVQGLRRGLHIAWAELRPESQIILLPPTIFFGSPERHKGRRASWQQTGRILVFAPYTAPAACPPAAVEDWKSVFVPRVSHVCGYTNSPLAFLLAAAAVRGEKLLAVKCFLVR